MTELWHLARAAWERSSPQYFFEVDDLSKMAGPPRTSAPHGSVSHEAGSTPERRAGLPVLVPSTVSTPFGDSGPDLGGWGREGTTRPAGGQGRARIHVPPARNTLTATGRPTLFPTSTRAERITHPGCAPCPTGGIVREHLVHRA